MPVVISEYLRHDLNNLDASHTDLHILSGNDYLTYIILDASKKYLLLKEYKREESEEYLDFHKNILENDELLQGGYRQIFIGIANKRLVLVPENLFDHTQAEIYLENSVPFWTSDQIIINDLPTQHIKLVYAIRKSLLLLFKETFPNGILHNGLSQYIKGIDKLSSGLEGGQALFVEVLSDTIYIVVYNGTELIYANVYSFQTKEDFLYYVMLIFKEFKLKQDTTPVYISGKLDIDSAIHDLLKQYIRELHFISVLGDTDIGLADSPPHIYYQMLCLSL